MNQLSEPSSVAIIGGGPGGLFAAYLMEHAYHATAEITVFEASGRVGGKIMTRQFAGNNISYEAGAAELYDYTPAGPDPLRDLVDDLGLATRPMEGRAVFLDGHLLRTEGDLERFFGVESMRVYKAFLRMGKSLISPAEYYESDWKEDRDNPLAQQTFEQLLDSISDDTVRRYVAAAVHSDVATEPQHTSALYGLQNFLMNEPGYMQLYSIDGGIEQLPLAVAERISADIRLDSRIERVESLPEGGYRISIRRDGRTVQEDFDCVIVALPNYYIPAINWVGEDLTIAMRAHHAHYDHPAHYLRVSLLFSEPFWRESVTGSYFMIDELGGCCVYDESCRTPNCAGSVLGWLIAGESAVTLSNLDDESLVARVLDSLPEPLQHGKNLMIDAKIHRWLGAVNGLPGGFPMREPDSRHQPDPVNNPMLFVVGDYLFDSTLNGVFDSADCVAGWVAEELADDLLDGVSVVSPAMLHASV